MSTTYRQLTLEQRYQIQSDLAAGFSVTQTAARACCHRSTVYRELKRCPGSTYRANMAQQASQQRRSNAAKHSKYSLDLWRIITAALKRSFSPAMISHRLRLECHRLSISTATLYRWLRWDWQHGGKWYLHLQRAMRPHRRAYGQRSWRSRYDDHRSIHDRPMSAQSRSRLGDWEGDTMYGKQGHLVTLVDRNSRFLLAKKIALRTKKLTTKAVVKMLKAQPGHTLTLDNGVEFADHKLIEKSADIEVYFADPYASWQRGSNENANGRLRRFIPRSADLANYSSQKLRRTVERLNHQPRKCLGWRSSYEVYYGVSVALMM